MASLARICLALLWVLAPACGGESGALPGELQDPNQPLDPPAPDPTTPTPQTPAACHPVLQAGCAAGQKCASVSTSGVATTQCVDAAAAVGGAGDACVVGTGGFDNCAPGFHCQGGACTEICGSSQPFRCTASGKNCVAAEAVFGDVPTEEVGLCSESCNPVAQGCPEGLGCYLDISNVSASCSTVAVGAAGRTQGDVCAGPQEGICYRNGCDAGFGALLPASFSAGTPSLCTQYCNPTDTHLEAPDNADGNPDGVTCPEGLQCRYVQTFYNGASQIPADIGICVPRSVWGDCSLCNIANRTTFAQTCTGQNAHGCVSGTLLPR